MNVNAAAYTGKNGKAGAAVGYSKATVDVLAAVDGQVNAGGNISVRSDHESDKNDTAASSTVGESLLTQFATKTSRMAAQWYLAPLEKKVSTLSESKYGFSGAVAYADHVDDVVARVGPAGSISSTNGSVEIAARSSDLPEVSAISDVESDPKALNTRANSLSMAVSLGQFENRASAYVVDGAAVRAPHGDLVVNAATHIPWEQQWWKWQGLSSITDKLNLNLGIQNGLFTSWAEAFAAGTDRAYGGSYNMLIVDSHSDAYIGQAATVAIGGDMSVIASNENDTVNFAGQMGYFLMGAGAVSGGSGVGGSVLVIDYKNHVRAQIKTGAQVAAGSLLVMARTDARNISLVTQGGKADEFERTRCAHSRSHPGLLSHRSKSPGAGGRSRRAVQRYGWIHLGPQRGGRRFRLDQPNCPAHRIAGGQSGHGTFVGARRRGR